MADPIMLPVETDPDQLAEIAFDYMNSAFDGWVPAEGNLETWLIRACARIVAEGRDVASDVPSSILRWYGQSVMRITPTAAVAATVTATVRMRDAEGYTVPRGLEVLVRTAGDDGVTFVVTEAVTVEPDPAGVRLDGDVVLRAVEPGEAGNGFGSDMPVEPLRALEFIESIRLTGTSANGQDAEGDDAYLSRLVDELELAAPRPILTRDFAILARRVPGVTRALAINNYKAKPELLRIVIGYGATMRVTDGASGATVTLTATMTRAQVAAAFTAAAITPRYGATVVGDPSGTNPLTIDVTLTGRERYGPWGMSVTGGATASSLQVTDRGGELSDVERSVSVAPVDAGGEPITGETYNAVVRLLDEMREVNFDVHVIEPRYTPIDVTFDAVAHPNEDTTTVTEAALAALHAYLSPATWGDPEGGDKPEWSDEPVVRYLEVAEVLNRVPGLRYVSTLGIARQGGTPTTADVVLDRPAALPRAGTGIRGEVREG